MQGLARTLHSAYKLSTGVCYWRTAHAPWRGQGFLRQYQCALNRHLNLYARAAFAREHNRQNNGGRQTQTHAGPSSPVTGLFDKPLLSTAGGFEVATEEALVRAERLVSEIWDLAEKPSIEIVYKMDELSDTLCQVADLAECIRLVHPDPTMSEAAQTASLVINNYVEQLNTDTRLHAALNNLMNGEDYLTFDDVTKRTCQLLMQDFEASGIQFEADKREKVVTLNREILQLGHHFMRNTTQPTFTPTAQCPPILQKYFPSADEHIIIDHVPLHIQDSQLRALSYKLYYTHLPYQEDILDRILTLRHQLATVAGYPTFSHRTLKSSMAEDPDVVREFLETLSKHTKPLAQEEAEEMAELKRNLGGQLDPDSLRPWDVTFCTQLAQKKAFPINQADTCNYFSLDACIAGLNSLFTSLFGVRLQRVPAAPGEVWEDDVVKLAFVHESEGLLGYTYCDFFSREGKAISDCHFTIQGGRELRDGSYQIPVITLCCSFYRKTIGDTVLLSSQAVENLFHEMGHALHSMLGRPKYQNVTGTRCSTDFAEVPSTLMEHFLNDERVLESFAHHYNTGESIPELHASAFQLSNKLFPAFDIQIQIVYALTDLLLHHHHPLNASSCLDLAAKIYQQYSPLEPVPNVTWCLRFNHFYGYGARYYSYLWSRAVSSLIWKKCFKNDPFSRDSGERLRQMLQYGGGVEASRLVQGMLGARPSVEDMVEALVEDVQHHQTKMRHYLRK